MWGRPSGLLARAAICTAEAVPHLTDAATQASAEVSSRSVGLEHALLVSRGAAPVCRGQHARLLHAEAQRTARRGAVRSPDRLCPRYCAWPCRSRPTSFQPAACLTNVALIRLLPARMLRVIGAADRRGRMRRSRRQARRRLQWRLGAGRLPNRARLAGRVVERVPRGAHTRRAPSRSPVRTAALPNVSTPDASSAGSTIGLIFVR